VGLFPSGKEFSPLQSLIFGVVFNPSQNFILAIMKYKLKKISSVKLPCVKICEDCFLLEGDIEA
jgi:hypothetical protein